MTDNPGKGVDRIPAMADYKVQMDRFQERRTMARANKVATARVYVGQDGKLILWNLALYNRIKGEEDKKEVQKLAEETKRLGTQRFQGANARTTVRTTGTVVSMPKQIQRPLSRSIGKVPIYCEQSRGFPPNQLLMSQQERRPTFKRASIANIPLQESPKPIQDIREQTGGRMPQTTRAMSDGRGCMTGITRTGLPLEDTRDRTGVNCYICQNIGHFAYECPRGTGCNICGSRKHTAPNCPDYIDGYKRQQKDRRNRNQEVTSVQKEIMVSIPRGGMQQQPMQNQSMPQHGKNSVEKQLVEIKDLKKTLEDHKRNKMKLDNRTPKDVADMPIEVKHRNKGLSDRRVNEEGIEEIDGDYVDVKDSIQEKGEARPIKESKMGTESERGVKKKVTWCDEKKEEGTKDS